jgi:ferredoxin
MCQFCATHGDGKRWYLNARNWANDLEADLARRGFVIGFVQGFESGRRGIRAGLSALKAMPRPVADLAREKASEKAKAHHFGQPVPLEDCEKILDIATHVTRVPCVCRGGMTKGSGAESCCMVVTTLPHDGLLRDAYRGYQGGPGTEGFVPLTKPEAMTFLRRTEQDGLCHTVWTFETPFLAAICNCDLPSGCMAMKLQLEAGVKMMWRGEDVMKLDPESCSGCALCVPLCPFGAITRPRKGEVKLDRLACWGCGTCRAGCHRGALALEPRAGAADVARLW